LSVDFVHLHNHSEYSLLDGIARTADIARRLKELQFDTYALTDHGVMYGSLEFYTCMRENGIKPIIGCEVYVAQRRLTDKTDVVDRKSWHCVLLASNHEGYVNLMQLTSIAHRFGYYYKPRVDVEAIREHSAGIVCLTACPNGIIAGPFHRLSGDDESHQRGGRDTGMAGGPEAARRELETYYDIFGPERLFLEIQNHQMAMERNYSQWAADQARAMGLRLVATNDNHYVALEDYTAHDIALCLRDKKLLSDADRLRYNGPHYYIKTREEMAALFPDYPEALANTRAVADLCNLELDLKKVYFPRFEILEEPELFEDTSRTDALVRQSIDQQSAEAEVGRGAQPTEDISALDPDQAKLDAYLRKLVYRGAVKRYGAVTDNLRRRIEYELSVIIPKGFTAYFLICQDFCAFARSKGIPVGPGRGSAAGSVVAYCLEITDLDPIKYGLYFERFLNPERVELPDADIDFCFRRREEVIEHVKRRYGADRVAMIVTYSRLKARAVIKAVARAKGLEYQYVDKVTKEIQGLNPTINEAVAGSAALQQMIKGDSVIAELIADAKRLEGIAAHHSVHAAGVVIAPDEISKYVPVQPMKDSDLLVTQYSMDFVPKAGLVKYDFLGLRNLTMIEDAAEYIRRYRDQGFDARAIPESDPATFAMLQRGDGYGVFQFEAPQVKKMLIDGRPESVEDLAAITSANRPGPMTSGNTARYLENRKNRQTGTSLYPSITEILEPTGGVLLFQEQVLEIARKLGGFSLGEADLLRKAMGKKNMEVMLAQQKQFLAGAADSGVPEAEADAIWDMMVQFAGYGFNKAHAVCYAWIAYQTAYLKCHYASFFMCAMLNSYMGNSSKLAEILAQCRRMRIPVLPPSVQEGTFEFSPTDDGKIIFGLGGIKGIGQGAVEGIVAQRESGGPFKDLPDFYQRTKGQGINKKVLQSLAMAGAFDSLGCERIELIRNLEDIESLCRSSKQEALFGDFDPGPVAGVTPAGPVTDYDVAMKEKEAIGLFLTNHPFADHPMYRDRRYVQLSTLRYEIEKNPQRWQDESLPGSGLIGLLTNVFTRTANTSSKTYAKARLEDPEQSVAVIVWPKAYEQAREIVEENMPVILWGRVQIPESADEADQAWDAVEVIVDRVEAYRAPESEAEIAAAAPRIEQRDSTEPDWDEGFAFDQLPSAQPQPAPVNGNGFYSNGHAATAKDEHQQQAAIRWEVDLEAAPLDALQQLAALLEQAGGDCEVQLKLKAVSGQLRTVRLGERFRTSPESAARIQQQFPFLAPYS
jgi:DNA polymerase III subunit alpha